MRSVPAALVCLSAAWMLVGCAPPADAPESVGASGGSGAGTGGGGAASGPGGGNGGGGSGGGPTPGATGGRGGSTGTATGGRGTAGGGTSGGGGGTAGAPVSTDPNDPLNRVVACTSGRMYSVNSGARGETMYPGDRCQGCHVWDISGTVYPTGHEQTLCNGQNGAGLTVVVSDSAGRVINLVPNSVGNFYYRGTITYPYTAKIIRGASVRVMATPQTNGECNACHTSEGIQGAPGRIVPPV